MGILELMGTGQRYYSASRVVKESAGSASALSASPDADERLEHAAAAAKATSVADEARLVVGMA